MKFKVGDRVNTINAYVIDKLHGVQVGDIGTVTRCGFTVLDVRYNKNLKRQSDSTNLNSDGTYQMNESQLELAPPAKSLIIYEKGNEVIANIKEGKNVVKSAKATCNPSDEFNFEVGVKLAFTRLMGEELAVKEIEAMYKPLTADGFKVGDKVKVRKNLYTGHSYGNLTLLNNMNHGHEMTIDYITSDGNFHCKGYAYSKEMLELVSKPTVKEVHRPAKVGEWIKATSNGTWHGNKYSVGDTYLVDDNYYTGNAYYHINKSDEIMLSIDNYVVLENYQPEDKPKTIEDFTNDELLTEIKRRMK